MFLSGRSTVLAALALFLIAALPPASPAQWSHQSNENTPVSTALNHQVNPASTPDGHGGTIIVWLDARVGGNWDLYAQRIDADGVARWTANGVAITTATGNQEQAKIVSDGAGGAIITWRDYRSGTNFDVYAQRVDSTGTVRWGGNGLAVCTASDDQYAPVIAQDGAGGAFIAWYDLRSGVDEDIYAQRVNASGAVLWTANGVGISVAAQAQYFPQIAYNGAGSAIIAWIDNRSGAGDIYAQRVAGSGLVQWAVNGIPVCNATGSQYSHVITGDGAGGAIVAWADPRSGVDVDTYAQRLDSTGASRWTANGAYVAGGAVNQVSAAIAADGTGGAFIGWHDTRYAVDGDFFVQKMDPLGYGKWSVDGVALTTATFSQDGLALVSDGTGGVIGTWHDFRILNFDIYAQRIDALGATRWTYNGEPVCRLPGIQAYPTIVSDGAGGAIIAWYDYRTEVFADLYAQKIDGNGYLGDNHPVLNGVSDVGGDQGGRVTVSWGRSWLDDGLTDMIERYTVWRGVDAAAVTGRTMFVEPLDTPAGTEPGTLRRLVTGTGTTWWELVGTVEAHHFPGYSFTAPTNADSGSGGVVWSKFLVSAHGRYSGLFWDSDADSGYSVDNLSPAGVSPVAATVSAGPSVTVHWKANTTDPDVKLYEVHRSLTGGFTPAPGTKIGQTVDTLLVDASPVAGAVNYYRVVTVDLHDNRSVPSAEAPAVLGSTQLYSVQDRWNLVSVPLVVADYAKTAVYPTAVSNAFAFTNQYTASPTLANGPGYWVKFNGAQSVPITGVPLESGSSAVQAGWNMVGSIGSAVEVGTISSTPPGLVTSNFFRFDAQYAASTTIEPGRGYWVKASGAGTLHLAAPGSAAADPAVNNPSARIRIVDDGEMPPPPPGEELTTELPGEYRLEQNYPNPFNPSTLIRYAVPEAVEVRITVYNQLGQEVAELVEGTVPAGYHEVEFNATDLPSGMYTYRIAAGTFTASRKMLLVR